MGKEYIKRRNYVIDKSFQFRFIATFLVIVVLSLAIFSAGFALYYWIMYMAGDNIFSEVISIHKQIPVLGADGKPMLDSNGNKLTQAGTPKFYNRLEIVLPPLLINNLIIMILISVIGIFYSHRIAGPVYRIETDISKVLAGEKGIKIHLRKNDKLKSLADKINALLDRLEKH